MKYPENKYMKELKKAMTYLGKQKNTIFIGQTVEYEGSPMFRSLEKVPISKRLELPVVEDMQMGMSIGLALEHYIPITIYPRMDFLMCAMNQLVNHLDKMEELTSGSFKPGVIIRTQVGNKEPLYPGPQHVGNYSEGLMYLLENIITIEVNNEDKIMDLYKLAYDLASRGTSVIMVEQPQGVIKCKE